MYTWLEEEISSVKKKDFFMIKPISKPVTDHFSGFYLPESYRLFLIKFGPAKLYKVDRYYQVQIVCPPEEFKNQEESDWLLIAHNEDVEVLFKISELIPGREPPVYEVDEFEHIPIKAANNFDDWIKMKANAAKKVYSKKAWKKIMEGAAPFNKREQEIVDSRTKFKWELIGFNEKGEAKIQIKNNSSNKLPFYSIGAKSSDNKISGAIMVNVSDLAPGKQKIYEHSAYNKFIARENLILFSLPDPDPDSKDQYWEFNKP